MPELMNHVEFRTKLENAIKGKSANKAPFSVAWASGKLSRTHLARWVVLVVCAFQMALPFAVSAPLMWAGAAVSLPVVALVVLNWRSGGTVQ